ncbi:hypothetical protein AAIB33_08105 [Microbacterium sp. AZCO]|uniref:hypothetical protein n=1 Tax=Microbacterium sp. AZCO TaxID=3142976 RepID=UPI0031F423BB
MTSTPVAPPPSGRSNPATNHEAPVSLVASGAPVDFTLYSRRIGSEERRRLNETFMAGVSRF